MKPMKPLALSLLLVSCLALASCGGGGGSSTQTGEVINGISVPPEPDPTANNSTLAGIDSNGNGVRDDVERKIATDFGNNPTKYQDIFATTKAEQAILINPSEENIAAYKKVIACSVLYNLYSSEEIRSIRTLNLKTIERSRAYNLALAGTEILPSDEVCK